MDEAVQSLLRACGVPPPRRAQPRLAAQLGTVDTRHVPFEDGTVAAWRVGEGPAALLVHGWGRFAPPSTSGRRS